MRRAFFRLVFSTVDILKYLVWFYKLRRLFFCDFMYSYKLVKDIEYEHKKHVHCDW